MSEDRKWRTKAAGGGLDGQYLIHTVYRFKELFRDPDAALALFREVPFLNGGLLNVSTVRSRPATSSEIRNSIAIASKKAPRRRSHRRIFGAARQSASCPKQTLLRVQPNVDLNEEFDTKGKVYKADGLIELFSRYKFTVEENTPVEEEVALDPELLGKVFENLLASYNADTRTTARKKSGSFYTPREVVDYMVDEALVAYFERRLRPRLPNPRVASPLRLVSILVPCRASLTSHSPQRRQGMLVIRTTAPDCAACSRSRRAGTHSSGPETEDPRFRPSTI